MPPPSGADVKNVGVAFPDLAATFDLDDQCQGPMT